MLHKQTAAINFSQGLDTKTDPKQVQLGKFLALDNSVFTKGGLFQKRNGFGPLASLPDGTSKYCTTFNGNLTAIGSNLRAYSQGSSSWVSKGAFQPLSVSVLPTVRSSLGQTQCDSAVAPNGLVCTVYTEANNGVSSYKYTVQDSTTGQAIVNPSVIPVTSGVITGSPRVFLLGNTFIIVVTNVIAAVSHLQYIAVSSVSPTTVGANTDIASAYTPSSSVSWDGVVVNNNLYIAYNTVTGGQQIKITYLSQSLSVAVPQSFAGSKATIMGMCADTSNPVYPVIYAAFFDSISTNSFVVAVDPSLNKLMTPTSIDPIPGIPLNSVTCAAQGGVVTVFSDATASYSYLSPLVSTDVVTKVPVTLPATVTTGTVGTIGTVLRSVGLASKAFIVNGSIYMLGAYQSTLQSTYFLFDSSGNIISRIAYENSGGYLTVGLPQAQVIGTKVRIAYLFKDLIEAVAPSLGSQGAPGTANIYSQTGVNLASFDFVSDTLSSSEIGGTLNLSGGQLWSYDGQTLSEQGFHLFPDFVKATQLTDPTATGNLANTTPNIASLSTTTNIIAGMTVTDSTNPATIPANTTLLSVGVGSAVMSANAAATHVGDSLTFTGAVSNQQYYYVAVYEWTDAQGNIVRSAPSVPVTVTTTAGHSSVIVSVPTLRLTYKSGVKIIIYRWSVAQQVYYQITSIAAPLLNDKTVDSVSFQDIQSDAQIAGNSILYTTGGVLENIAGPASSATTLFDDRLWLIDAEDQNLLWNSKQLIEATPVEMSDLLTTYVAPSTGSQGSTGVMKCIFPMDDKLIVFKKDAIYYINGTGPDNTGANGQYSQPIFITATVGCSNQNSIVFMPQGLMFQSDKGIWLLGRDLSTQYIGAPVEQYNSLTVNSAVGVPGTNQVRFTLSGGITLMYDYFYSQWGTFSNVPAVSSTLYQSLHTYINSSGSVFQETPGVYLDNSSPVLVSFTTSWLNMAGLQGYMRSYFFYLLGQYYSPHKLSVSIAYDYNPSPSQNVVITPTNFAPYYGESSPFGQESTYGGPGDLEQWRVFLTKQRCQSFQITLKEFYDASMGQPSGQGLTLSGINLVYGIKSGFRPMASKNSVGRAG